MATKVIKEIITDVGGNTTIEYSDDTTQKYNVADVVTAQSNPVTGGISLLVGGEQAGGNSAPSVFVSRAVAAGDNGMVLTCASAQVATVNTGLPVGFGVAFKGAVTFAGTATVTDARATGSASPWCGLVQTAANTYDVVGNKA